VTVSGLAVRAVVLALAPTFAVHTAGAQRFEGIITMKVSGALGGNGAGGRGVGRGGGRPAEVRPPAGRGDSPFTDEQAAAMRSALSSGLQNIEYMTRRGRIRIGIGAAAGAQSPAAMIYVPDEGVMFTLLPALSMYSETVLADFAALAGEQATTAVPSTPAPRPPIVTHTRKFELVAGHKCEHVTIEYARQKTDVCMGKGLGVFVMPTIMGSGGAWSRVLSDENGFPLKVTQGNGTVTMEVTKIERKALPEALFNVPDTYTRMPDMLRRPPGSSKEGY